MEELRLKMRLGSSGHASLLQGPEIGPTADPAPAETYQKLQGVMADPAVPSVTDEPRKACSHRLIRIRSSR